MGHLSCMQNLPYLTYKTYYWIQDFLLIDVFYMLHVNCHSADPFSSKRNVASSLSSDAGMLYYDSYCSLGLFSSNLL